MIQYPDTPEKLRLEHPAVWNAAFSEAEGIEGMPKTCQVDERILEQIRIRLPARKTHNSISHFLPKGRMPALQPVGRTLPALTESELPMLPGFRFLGRHAADAGGSLPGTAPHAGAVPISLQDFFPLRKHPQRVHDQAAGYF